MKLGEQAVSAPLSVSAFCTFNLLLSHISKIIQRSRDHLILHRERKRRVTKPSGSDELLMAVCLYVSSASSRLNHSREIRPNLRKSTRSKKESTLSGNPPHFRYLRSKRQNHFSELFSSNQVPNVAGLDNIHQLHLPRRPPLNATPEQQSKYFLPQSGRGKSGSGATGGI